MKEKEFKKILEQTEIDADGLMDQRIEDNLLMYNPDEVTASMTDKPLNRKSLRLLSKAAAAILVVAFIGGATAWASGLLVKTEPVTIKISNEEEASKLYEELGLDAEESRQKFQQSKTSKVFGNGNDILPSLFDSRGNLAERDENGELQYKDSSVAPTPKALDPNIHVKDRESSKEAFAELGIPNIIPDYIYDNYLISPEGIVLSEYNVDGHIVKNIMVCFYPDYTAPEFAEDLNSKGPMFVYNKHIWFTITATGEDEMSNEVIAIREDGISGTMSTYTTKNGLICSIEELNGHFITHIHFSSKTFGSGSMLIEFVGMPMEKAHEILDMIPLVEDFSHSNGTEE